MAYRLTPRDASTTFVPYTGATANVDLGVWSLTASNLQMPLGGSLFWDSGGVDQTSLSVYTEGILALERNDAVNGAITYIDFTAIGTADKTFTLPDASGTVALVGGNDTELIYNNAGALAGATNVTFNNATPAFRVDLQSGTGDADVLLQAHDATYANYTYFQQQPTILYFGAFPTGQYSFGNAADDLYGVLDFSNIATTGKTFTFPNTTGTIALTSDVISDHGGLGGLTDDDHPQYVKDSEFTADGDFLVGTGVGTFAAESGATARASLGLTIGTHVLAYDADLSALAGDATFTQANWTDLTDGGATTLHSHAGSGAHTIRENGTDQTARTGLNFIDASAGVGLITDDGVGDETEVNLDLYLLASGARALTANWDAGSFEVRAQTFQSDVATGTAPFIVASTTVVTNLNADLLDSQTGSYYLDAANFTGTNWTDLTDAGATTLHKHDHGGMDGLADNDHPQYLLLAGGTMTGNINLGEAQDPADRGIVMDGSLSADERYSGITIPGTAGTTIAFGDLCYLDVTAGEWLLADADAATTAGDVPLGICVDASTDGAATSMLVLGTVRSAAFPASIALGAPVYVSTTAGDIQTTQPSGVDDVIRVCGWAITTEPNTIYFNPSSTYITHT